MRLSLLIIAIFFATGWAHVVFAQPDVKKMVAESDPTIQAQIRAVYDANSEAEAFRQSDNLKRITDDKAKLVKQLAIFAVAATNKKEMHELLTLIILNRLELSPGYTIRVLAPYLGSDNKQLRDFAYQWFESHDRLSNDPLEPGNYKNYADYLGNTLARDEDIPAAFVEYLFERSPERALLAFYRGTRAHDMVPMLKAMGKNLRARRQQIEAVEMPPPQANGSSGNIARLEAFGRKLANAQERAEIPKQVEVPEPPKPDREVLLAAHIVEGAIWLHENKFDEQFQQALPEAQQELSKLSEHDHWWARLYVAEIMNKHPELRDREVVELLKDDSNDIVVRAARKAAKAIQRTDETKRAKWLEKHGTATEKLLARKRQPIQEQIRRVHESLRTYPTLDPFSNMEAMQETQELKNIIDNKFEIVSQIAIFAAQPGGAHSHAKTILELLDLPPQIAVRELAPYLNTDNKNLRSFVRDWFQAHDNARPDISALEEVNFKEYLVYIRGQLSLKQEVPTGFVEYIYEQQPSRALLAFAYAATQPEKQREIESSDRIVSNAIWLNENGFAERFQQALPEVQQELKKLAEHDQWWARLYVAEIMRRHRELRDPDVLDKLREDENERVRKAAKGKQTKSAARTRAAEPVALVAPTDVQARAIGGNTVRVDWSPSVGATSYMMYCAANRLPKAALPRLPPT